MSAAKMPVNTAQPLPRAPWVSQAPHGTLSGYQMGCRCTFCESAKAATGQTPKPPNPGGGLPDDHRYTGAHRATRTTAPGTGRGASETVPRERRSGREPRERRTH